MSSAPNPTAPASSATASSAPATREAAAMSVRHAAVWAMAGQYISFAIMFANSVIISRFFLTPAEIGLFSIALAASMVAAVLQDFGLSRYIAGLRVVDAEALSRCASVAFLFSFVVAGIIAASAWPMALTYHQKALFPILLIIAASYLFVPLSVVPMALMGRTMSFHGHFCVNVGGAVALAGSALTLSALGLSSFALAWATLIAAIARAAIAQALRPAAPWPLRTDGVRPIMANGAKLTTLYGIGALGSRTPDMILGKILGLVSVGLYSRAAGLSDQFRMLISGAIGQVFYPAFARIRDAGEPLGPAYLRVCAGYSAIIWPSMAGLALAAGPVVRLLYGPRWEAAAPLLSLISLTEVLLISLPLVSDLPILLGRANRLIALNLVDTAMSVSLMIAGCHWGVQGA
ncbi:MAG TPA: oligosaccharide flippase family protein, partial [Novosphingobium sp.]|nr:oligosaccharide flippase family protein [Novosphingobium sp.]